MVKRQIQKRESKKERQERYAKRSKGLQKKVSELSILCDVDVGLIMFSPNGKLKHYSNQPKIETVLQEFIQGIPNMPVKEREKFVCLQTSQDIIDRINIAAGPDDVADQQGSDAPQREEVNREIIELQIKLMLLQEQERMLDPTMGTLNSEQEREDHINRLRENALIMIAKRKEELMSVQGSYNLTPDINPSVSVQQQIESMQGSGMHRTNFCNKELEARFAVTKIQEAFSSVQQKLNSGNRSSIGGAPHSLSMQDIHTKLPIQVPPPRIETGMWGQHQEGKQLQVPPQQVPPPRIETGMWGQHEEGKQLQVPPQQVPQPRIDTGMWDQHQEVKQLQVSPQQGQQYFQQPPQHGMTFSENEQPSSNLSSQLGGVFLNGVQFSNEDINFLSNLIG